MLLWSELIVLVSHIRYIAGRGEGERRRSHGTIVDEQWACVLRSVTHAHKQASNFLLIQQLLESSASVRVPGDAPADSGAEIGAVVVVVMLGTLLQHVVRRFVQLHEVDEVIRHVV